MFALVAFYVTAPSRKALTRLFLGLVGALSVGAICGVLGWGAAHWMNETFDRSYDPQKAGTELASAVAGMTMIGVVIWLIAHP